MKKPIRVYTPHMDLLLETDNYLSLQFRPKFYEIGEFELHVNQYIEGAQYFQKNNLIMLDKQPNKVMIIKHREIPLDENGKASENWKITGYTLEGVLNQRITIPPEHTDYDRKSGDAETVMKHYVYRHFVNPDDPDRKIDYIEIAPNKHRGPYIEWESRYKNVGDEIVEISKAANLGWTIYADMVQKKWIFDVIEPRDLTQDNPDGNPPVFFSPDFQNIKSQTFVDSEANYKNVAIVGGEGEGVERKVVTVGEGEGLGRLEVFIDARDIQSVQTDEEGNEIEIPEEEVIKQLIERGQSKLNSEFGKNFYLEAQILTPTITDRRDRFAMTTPFEYEKDFRLGDVVKVFNKKWNITMDAPITEFNEIHESSGFVLEATFGEAVPTLITKIKREFDDLKGVEKQEIPAKIAVKHMKEAQDYTDRELIKEQQERIRQAQENLGTAKRHASEEASKAEENSKQYTDEQIELVLNSFNDLIDTLADGIIEESEAIAIEKFLQQLELEKSDYDARYNSLFNNEHLPPTDKTNLIAKKNSYDTAYENLVSTIENAISDKRATEEEIAEINTRIRLYEAALIDLSDILQRSVDIIAQVKANQAENNAKSHADSVSYTAEQNAKNHADTIAEQKKQEAINAAIADADAKLSAAKTELEADIALKADAEWVNGQLVLKENAITKSNTAPANPTTGQLWLDTSVTPNVLKRWSGSAWVKATPTSAGEVGAYTKTEVDNALNSKVSITQYTTDMNGVITRLDSAESRITQTENEIATKVEKSEFDSVTNSLGNRIATVEQTAEGIRTEVSDIRANVYTKSEVDSAIDGIQVGGRNLLRNSDFSQGTTWWSGISEIVDGYKGYKGAVLERSGYSGSNRRFLTQNHFSGDLLTEGETYTLSGWFYIDSSIPLDSEDNSFFVRKYQSGTTGTFRDIIKFPVTLDEFSYDTWYYFKATGTVPEGYNGGYQVAFALGKNGRVIVSALKLEKGSKATDWTPAPEDIDAQIADIEGTLESHSTKIEQNAQQIQLRATKEEVDTLSGRVNQAESQITQLAGQIELRATKTEVDALTGQVSNIQSQLTVMAEEISAKVEKDGIINAINISTEGIKISGTKLHITAQTTIDNAVIKDAHIDKMSATKLTAGTINADLITISNDKVTINTSGVSVKDGDFIMIDGVTGANYSMTPKTNLIKDHSFETLQPTGSVGTDDFFAIADVMGSQWTKTGNPRLATSEGRETGNTEAIYGNQSVVVNNANYVEYAMPYVRLNRGITYTISLYAKKAIAYTAGIPRIYLYVYNENPSNGSKTTLWSTTLTANMAPPTDYRAVRFVFNFTMPNLTSNIDTYTQFAVRVLSANSNWVIVDGVQLVEGSSAGPYDAENSFFDFMNGYLPVRRLNSTGEIIARGWVYTDAIDSNPYSAGVHLYGRPTASGEFRVTTTGTTSTYRPIRALFAYVDAVDINTGTHMYIRPASNGVARVTSTGTTQTYRPIEASSFNQRSLEKDKTKIELFTDSALKIIRQTDIYKYQMKSDVEVGQGKDRYGVVIGDGYNTPDEFLSYDRTSVDLYSEASIAIKAIQELDDEQQELKGRIAWLEAENKLLREKIKKLEGMIA